MPLSQADQFMSDDSARLDALQQVNLLDTPPEEAFDRLTRLASKILHAPVSLISLVDRERQFFKSAVGPPDPWGYLRETPLSHSFCQHVVASSAPLIISDARRHPLVHDNLATSEMGVVAYAGMPLTTSEGHTLGSFCAIDTQPRQWTEEEIEILRELAASAMTEVELRLTARQLHENYQELQKVHRQLQALEALRDDLTHMIVHDLRTPLTSLMSGVQLMELVGELNDEQQEILKISVDGGNVLLGMINDLLDISKMESGALRLEYKNVTANELLEGAQQQVQALVAAQGLTLISEAAPEMPSFRADEDKLLRTLVNLLGNAVKFTPEGGFITMSARLAKDEQGVVFAVNDTGEGIPQDELQRIFEKFGQVETRRSGRKMSTGLGLTFCKLVVESHGGCLWVESELNKGSTFSFRIPR
jgi:signal transduction histidine kinase